MGDHRAIKLMLQLMEQAVDPEDFEVSADAEAILKDYVSKHQDCGGPEE